MCTCIYMSVSFFFFPPTSTSKHTTTEYKKSKFKAGESLQMFAANCVRPVDLLNIHDLRLTAIISEPQLSKDAAQLRVWECIITHVRQRMTKDTGEYLRCVFAPQHAAIDFPYAGTRSVPFVIQKHVNCVGVCMHACISLYKVHGCVFCLH